MTATTTGTWDAVATLLSYPDADATPELLAACTLLEGVEGLDEAARDFRAFVEENEPTRREERFTTDFDINPKCTLELGWHLYGEDYKRGSFLVDMRGLMAAVGIEETPELPDHMTHALRVLDRLPAPKSDQLSTEYIQPALAKMLEGYDETESPWHPLLVAVLKTLEATFGETHEVVGNPSTESQGPYEAVPASSICAGCAQDWPGAEEEEVRHARK